MYPIDHPDRLLYHGRYWATVKLNHGPIQDPASKSVERIVVPLEQAAEVLGWGQKGETYMAKAYQAMIQSLANPND